jgi:hypothetical protein
VWGDRLSQNEKPASLADMFARVGHRLPNMEFGHRDRQIAEPV